MVRRDGTSCRRARSLRKVVHRGHEGDGWVPGPMEGRIAPAERGGGRPGRPAGPASSGPRHEEMVSMGLDLGIFTCDRPLREFYQRAGWEELPGTVLVGGTPQEPFASDQSMKRASKTIHSDLRWAV